MKNSDFAMWSEYMNQFDSIILGGNKKVTHT